MMRQLGQKDMSMKMWLDRETKSWKDRWKDRLAVDRRASLLATTLKPWTSFAFGRQTGWSHSAPQMDTLKVNTTG